MPTVLLDVPAQHLDAFLLVLSEVPIMHRWLDSRDGVLEVVHTVEVSGSDLQVKEAVHLLSQMGLHSYVFHVSDKQLNRTLKIAQSSGLKVVRMTAGIRFFGRLRTHIVEVSGIESDLKNFKILKRKTYRITH